MINRTSVIYLKAELAVMFSFFVYPRQCFLCHIRPQKCSVCRNHNSVLSSFITYHRLVTRETRWVTYVEQKVITLSQNTSHPPPPPVFCWVHIGLFSHVRLLITSLVFSYVRQIYRWCLCIFTSVGN
jgi:hypothetical protein